MNSFSIGKNCSLPRASSRQSIAIAVSLVAGGSFTATAQSQESVANDYALEEVIVTSRKRSETMLDIPFSISVASADTIASLGEPGVRNLGSGLWFMIDC